jgi:hypothetical protein
MTLSYRGHQRPAVRHGTDEIEVVFQELRNSGRDQGMIVCQQDASAFDGYHATLLFWACRSESATLP